MKLLFLCAWRNIWRNKRRSFLTLSAIAFATAILVFFICLQFSSYATSINVTTSMYQGHLQVQNREYFDKPQIEKTILAPESLRTEILQLPLVQAAALRSFGFALVSSADRSYGVQIVGVEPEQEVTVATLPKNIKSGHYLLERTASEAVIGNILARNLRVGVGDELTLLGQGREASLAAAVLRIVGVFESASNELNRVMVQIPLGTFRETFNFGDEAHAIVIQGQNVDQTDELQKQIESTIKGERWGPVAPYRWDELLPGLRQAIDLDMVAAWLFYGGLVLVVACGVINTFLMSVMERVREFGVMLALGASPRTVSTLILIECVALAGVGILCGLALGAAIVSYYGVVGFSVPGSDEIMKLWNLPGKIYTHFTPTSLLLGPSVVFVASLLAIIYPVLQIWKLRPVEAMRRV